MGNKSIKTASSRSRMIFYSSSSSSPFIKTFWYEDEISNRSPFRLHQLRAPLLRRTNSENRDQMAADAVSETDHSRQGQQAFVCARRLTYFLLH